jgi:hypothetical protein
VEPELVTLVTRALAIQDSSSRARSLEAIWGNVTPDQQRELLGRYYWDLSALAARDLGIALNRSATAHLQHRFWRRLRRGLVTFLQVVSVVVASAMAGILIAYGMNR